MLNRHASIVGVRRALSREGKSQGAQPCKKEASIAFGLAREQSSRGSRIPFRATSSATQAAISKALQAPGQDGALYVRGNRDLRRFSFLVSGAHNPAREPGKVGAGLASDAAPESV